MHYKDYVPQSALLHHDSIIAITYIISLNLRFIKEIYSVRRLKKDEFSWIFFRKVYAHIRMKGFMFERTYFDKVSFFFIEKYW